MQRDIEARCMLTPRKAKARESGCSARRALAMAAVLLIFLALVPQRALGQMAQVEMQRPWAYTRYLDRLANTIMYMATTPAIDEGDFWLLLACREDGFLVVSFIHGGGFPYPLGSSTNLALRIDLLPAITTSARSLENRQISMEVESSGHLLRPLVDGRQLSVTVTDGDGHIHGYKFSLHPNDLALKDIRATCLDPFRGDSRLGEGRDRHAAVVR
jgi:hypothetical protein